MSASDAMKTSLYKSNKKVRPNKRRTGKQAKLATVKGNIPSVMTVWSVMNRHFTVLFKNVITYIKFMKTDSILFYTLFSKEREKLSFK